MVKVLRSAVLTGFFPGLTADPAVAVGAIEMARELGYDVIELYYDGPDAGRVQRAARDSGLEVIFLAAFFMKPLGLDMGAADQTERRSAVSQVKGLIDRCLSYGAGTLMVISGPEREDPAERDRAMDRLADSLIEVCGHAREAGITITLEYFNNVGEPRLLVGPTATAARLARRVRERAENFVLTFDLSHALQLGEDPAAGLVEIADVCSHVHLANCVIGDPASPLFGDKHPRFGHPEGEVDAGYVRRFMGEVVAAGYLEHCDGPLRLGVEIIARGDDDPQTELRAATAVLDEAIEIINQEVGE